MNNWGEDTWIIIQNTTENTNNVYNSLSSKPCASKK